MPANDSFRRERKRLFVDIRVQRALVLRAVGYWAFCLLSISLMLLCWRILTGPPRMFYMHVDELWFQFGPALVASCLLIPMVLIDLLRISNRVVGPMVRLRRLMRDLADGKKVTPITFRDADFWHDFSTDFNAMVERVESLEARHKDVLREPDSEEESPEPLMAGTAD